MHVKQGNPRKTEGLLVTTSQASMRSASSLRRLSLKLESQLASLITVQEMRIRLPGGVSGQQAVTCFLCLDPAIVTGTLKPITPRITDDRKSVKVGIGQLRRNKKTLPGFILVKASPPHNPCTGQLRTKMSWAVVLVRRAAMLPLIAVCVAWHSCLGVSQLNKCGQHSPALDKSNTCAGV